MGKKLSEMSLEELWQLFPIILTAHQPAWIEWYAQEAAFLAKNLSQDVKISHIGSTAVDTIWAKPIVDILVEAPGNYTLESLCQNLIRCGYICMSHSDTRISLNKGYTENGFAERVFHLHLRYVGDNDELYFRDYLLANPGTAQEYNDLKLGIWKEFEHNRDGYTAAKTDFVSKYTALAKSDFGNRY